MKSGSDSLPEVLRSIDSFVALPEVERLKFRFRIQSMREIVLRVEEFLADEGKRDDLDEIRDLLDNLELDLMNALSIRSTQEKISPWLIHSSWTFGASVATLSSELPSDEWAKLQENPPSSSCEASEFLEWVSARASSIRVLLESFLKSDTRDAAVGCLIAIHIALEGFLLGVSRQRLNPRIWR